ncbi:E3 ubiquitin/ISG15 ligase TRIM25-like [Genypterus blacodes]|uniref:E3 ubiquitin/ISG15 ligase TRIM25-like n=1 Tax=Genypterus blacodes TaxID=154954 RepID=UPI003F773B8A
MASTSGFLSEEQFLCSICLDVFNEPVSTPCGHNFCKACITGYWSTTQLCCCPLCKKTFVNTPDLFTNTLISEMVTQFKKSVDVKSPDSHHQEAARGEDIPCDICSGTKLKALKSCLVCLASYCETHLEPHQRVPALKRHKLISPVQNLEDRVCKKHDKMFELFCKNDQVCVCVMCTEHKAHDTVPLEEEYVEKNAQLDKKKAEVRKMIQERQQIFEQMKASVQSKRTDKYEAIAKCAEVFTAQLATIQKLQAELFHVIEEQHKEAEMRDEDLLKELEDEITELWRRSSEMELLSHTEDHLQLLQNFQSVSNFPPTKNWVNTTVSTVLYMAAVNTAVALLETKLTEKMSTVINHMQEVKQDLSKLPDEVKLRWDQQLPIEDATSHPLGAWAKEKWKRRGEEDQYPEVPWETCHPSIARVKEKWKRSGKEDQLPEDLWF